MSNKSDLIQTFVLFLAVGIFSSCAAQTSPKENQSSHGVGAQERNTAADEARIEGTTPDYEIKETTQEYLQSLPMPELKFVFQSKTIENKELPNDIKGVLDAHWKEALRFTYENYLHKPADGQTAYKMDIAWVNFCHQTDQKLQKLLIDAPYGKRNISQSEAMDLWGFLNGAAAKVMDKAKNIKQI